MADTPPTTLSLQLAQQDIEKIIHGAIQAQVVAAMKANGDVIIAQYVQRMLTEKVDGEGKTSGYTNSNSPTFLQWLSAKTIREAAAEAVREWLAENKPLVVKAVKAALTKNKEKLAEQAAQTLLSAGDYGLNVTIDVARRERG